MATVAGSLSTTLRPPWVYVAWAGWSVVAALAVSIAVIGAVETAQAPLPGCLEPGASCSAGTLSLEDAMLAERLGWPVPMLPAGLLAVDALAKLGVALAGLLIFWLRRDDWVALMMSAALVLVLVEGRPLDTGLAPLALTALTAIGFALFVPLPFIFPNGRHEPRWTRAVSIPLAVALPATFLLGSSFLTAYIVLLTAWVALSVGAMVFRFRHAATPLERQQLKWVTLGMSSGLLVGVIYTVGGGLYPVTQPSPDRLAFLVLFGMLHLAGYWALAIGIGVAVLRHGLWSIDPVLNRALVFGALTTAVIGGYVLIVGTLGALFHSSGNLAFALLATGVIALLLNPFRVRVQRGVNRLMYGERDDPYSVLSRLSQRLDLAAAPEAAMPVVAETVAQALRLPYVAIRLGGRTAASQGALPAGMEPETFELVHQGATIGQFVAAPREAGATFTPAERRLLHDIARQAAMAAHAVMLGEDLQRARERLVSTREEERRRLRRDLHDGLGPRLAGQALILEAVRDSLPADSQGRALVDHLIGDSQTIVAEVRELVHDLRPPALDELGLVGAVRAYAAQCQLGGLQIRVVAPATMPPLPAAVEVAAYRIAQEAMTNVVKHAGARACEIRIDAAEDLELEIRDDGCGIPPGRRWGVGLASMRERAEEIGGRLAIGPGMDGGTMIAAVLPLAVSAGPP